MATSLGFLALILIFMLSKKSRHDKPKETASLSVESKYFSCFVERGQGISVVVLKLLGSED